VSVTVGVGEGVIDGVGLFVAVRLGVIVLVTVFVGMEAGNVADPIETGTSALEVTWQAEPEMSRAVINPGTHPDLSPSNFIIVSYPCRVWMVQA
jgi:hypothetical protein